MFHLLKTQRTLDGKFNISTEKQKKNQGHGNIDAKHLEPGPAGVVQSCSSSSLRFAVSGPADWFSSPASGKKIAAAARNCR